MFSVITNIYNRKTKGPTLMEFLTATGKLIFFYNQRCSMCAVSPVVHTSNISSCKKKKLVQFLCGCEKFHKGRSFGFLVINVITENIMKRPVYNKTTNR